MKIEALIDQGWKSYLNKVSSNLLYPENEKMMQLQLAQIFQTLAPIYEYERSESIKVLLEVPATINNSVNRIIDIVISHEIDSEIHQYPIELKCFRLFSRNSTKKRGAQNLGMYDYWEDIENIEGYSELTNFRKGFQLTLTDDPYYVTTEHKGAQVKVYSTSESRNDVTGVLEEPIKNRQGRIELKGTYSMSGWKNIGDFYFISQVTKNA